MWCVYDRMCVCVLSRFAGMELEGERDGRESPNCVFVAGSENEKTGCHPDILSHALRRVSDQMYARHLEGQTVPERAGPPIKTCIESEMGRVLC